MMQRAEEHFYNRDLSWLLFNRRVISLSTDPTVPLLERLKFIAIAANNLDEFFNVRVPSIQSLITLGQNGRDPKSGLTPQALLAAIHDRNLKNISLQYDSLSHLLEILSDQHVFTLTHYNQLTQRQRMTLATYFTQRVTPFITVIPFNPEHPFPKFKDGSMTIGVTIHQQGQTRNYLIPVPAKLKRLVKVPADQHKKTYLLLEDLMVHELAVLFPNASIRNAFVFRITRDKDIDMDVEKDETAGTVAKMEQYLIAREKGHATRLEVDVANNEPDAAFLEALITKIQLPRTGYDPIPGPLDLTFLFQLCKKFGKKHPHLLYPPFVGRTWPKDASMLSYLEKQDLLLQYPYDAFSQFLHFLEEAINDPEVIAIKQTIYRVAEQSQVIALLKKAAKRGIKVSVLIELRARFDEEHNLELVDELEDAGCTVYFGKEHMKVHSKTCLILKKAGAATKGFVHIGTGNYNEQSAQQFVDLNLFSSRSEYVNDLEAFFHYLETPDAQPPTYEVVTASPHRIEDMVIQNIQHVTDRFLATGQGRIFLKTNAITDKEVIDAIYAAAKLGVPFRLVDRGACCLKLGVCGDKEDIVVSSIVGELLEHSRIYAFFTDEEPSLWISSADLMTRNMDNRVELAAPILDAKLKQELLTIIELYAQDDVDGFFLNKDGRYFKSEHPLGQSAQQTFIQMIDHQPKTSELNQAVSLSRTKLQPWFTRDKIYQGIIITLLAIILWLVYYHS
ncbi:polyphosphate kinase 1 [Weissella halotolerans]|uniref:Polyphosphate kinase n=1 Tax=Weissella halotolerans DSM 20190 TaxID=1123500 RepID=A0A0R2FV97_9LACO|nr:polyphosphate kinase 1 [Weissella halotolerans]KRN32176.1 polyphosphate kinase [Weissella halotolerans DSM 20190]